jgi:predicted 2-oxoglutarate/Fe(II)-dependent dioxygenase YbiX
VHDEYWHRHVDRENTEHYHYSGLLYMSDFGTDFTGGLLHFYSASTPSKVELTVEPRAGRVVIFTAGSENPHMVERVTSGDRLVLSFWFTCNVKREFEIFLDGAAHVAFSEKTKAQLLRQQQQQQQQQQRQGQEL